mmetsp:Transcript_7076/g.43596  ORF Transcript_7076/g.43596 Transcript_7076/m.43596 type:complete len:358 (+) Transcript_7076:828-1901(+)
MSSHVLPSHRPAPSSHRRAVRATHANRCDALHGRSRSIHPRRWQRRVVRYGAHRRSSTESARTRAVRRTDEDHGRAGRGEVAGRRPGSLEEGGSGDDAGGDDEANGRHGTTNGSVEKRGERSGPSTGGSARNRRRETRRRAANEERARLQLPQGHRRLLRTNPRTKRTTARSKAGRTAVQIHRPGKHASWRRCERLCGSQKFQVLPRGRPVLQEVQRGADPELRVRHEQRQRSVQAQVQFQALSRRSLPRAHWIRTQRSHPHRHGGKHTHHTQQERRRTRGGMLLAGCRRGRSQAGTEHAAVYQSVRSIHLRLHVLDGRSGCRNTARVSDVCSLSDPARAGNLERYALDQRKSHVED